MYLHYSVYGSESLPALIILHGLLGSSDNWHSFGKIFGERFRTFIPDARNHGRSPHIEGFNYQAMAEDVREFIQQQNLFSVSLLGHSMGGKTAALAALLYPELVEKLIVVDIAPRSYEAHHDKIFDTLVCLDLSVFRYRKDIDDALRENGHEASIRQFLLKNLMRDAFGQFQWKMNLEVIKKNYARINEELPNDRTFDKPTLFLKGEKSNYIQMDDLPMIRQLFPQAEVVTVKNTAHWIHIEAPKEFSEKVLDFLSF
jgi:esterase